MENSLFYEFKNSSYVIREGSIYKIKKDHYLLGSSFNLCQTHESIVEFFVELFNDRIKRYDYPNVSGAIRSSGKLVSDLGYGYKYFTVKENGFVELYKSNISLYFKYSNKNGFSEISEEVYKVANRYKMREIKIECQGAGIDIEEFKNIDTDDTSIFRLAYDLKIDDTLTFFDTPDINWGEIDL